MESRKSLAGDRMDSTTAFQNILVHMNSDAAFLCPTGIAELKFG